VEWVAVVRDAEWCDWSSSPKVARFDALARCASGRVARSATFRANTSIYTLDYMLSLTVLGKTKTLQYLRVVQAGHVPIQIFCATASCPDTLAGSFSQVPALLLAGRRGTRHAYL
jgi:hypothetical protein